MDTITLGTGILNWSRHERITDRYGTVHLNHAPDGADFDPAPFDTVPVGTRGQLVAVILRARRSTHCADLARGLAPTTPAVGEEVTLGVGTLIVAGSDHGPYRDRPRTRRRPQPRLAASAGVFDVAVAAQRRLGR